MPKKRPLLPGQYYHIYNRGNNKRVIFRNDENYRYFLRLLKKHIVPVAKIYAYSLLPNHFHFLIQIKPENELLKLGVKSPKETSRKFANAFSAYAMAYNKKYKTVSSLFEQNFERTLVTNEAKFDFYLYYLHWNPQHHQLVLNFKDWKHISYHSILSSQKTLLEREFILNRFDGLDNFIAEHQKSIDSLDWQMGEE